jgi:DNA polymerase-3 subunit epsilon
VTWHLGRLAPLDFETTGTDPEDARIVEAYLGYVGGGQDPVDRQPLLIDPGVEIPSEAAKIHGYTTEHVREHGMQAAEGVGRIAAAVAAVWAEGIPLVGHNIGQYDLTVLDREMVRHGLGSLVDLMGSYGPVIDTQVLSKHVDRWRPRVSAEQGAHQLKTCAQVFRIPWVDENAHGARYDALISGRVAWRMGTIAAMPCDARPRIQSGRRDERHLFDDLAVPLSELFASQRKWAAEQAASYQNYLRDKRKSGDKHNPDAVIDGTWPVQAAPAHTTAAQEASTT